MHTNCNYLQTRTHKVSMSFLFLNTKSCSWDCVRLIRTSTFNKNHTSGSRHLRVGYLIKPWGLASVPPTMSGMIDCLETARKYTTWRSWAIGLSHNRLGCRIIAFPYQCPASSSSRISNFQEMYFPTASKPGARAGKIQKHKVFGPTNFCSRQ